MSTQHSSYTAHVHGLLVSYKRLCGAMCDQMTGIKKKNKVAKCLRHWFALRRFGPIIVNVLAALVTVDG